MSQPPILLVLGEEQLLVKKAEQEAVDTAFGGGRPGFNLSTFSAEEGADGAVAQAQTLPMMAKKRVVVVRQMEKASPALLDSLLAYADNPNPSTVLILTGTKTPAASGGIDRGKRLANKVEKLGGLVRFKAKEVRPGAFVRERAAEAGCTLDGRAERLLVELVGTDLGQLSNEVDKAIAWVGGRGAIAVADVEAVCSVVSEAVVWDLTDAIIQRNVDRGLAAAHRMLDDAGSGGAHRLLLTVTWQMRQLLELQDALRRGAEPPGSWRRVPRQKLNAAQKSLRDRALDPGRVLGALAAANRDFNRSPAGERRVFEGLVLRLTTSGL